MILAGDVGGTKTVLSLFARSGDGLREIDSRTFPSREYPSLEGIVAEFLSGNLLTEEPNSAPQAACFGWGGPDRADGVRGVR